MIVLDEVSFREGICPLFISSCQIQLGVFSVYISHDSSSSYHNDPSSPKHLAPNPYLVSHRTTPKHVCNQIEWRVSVIPHRLVSKSNYKGIPLFSVPLCDKASKQTAPLPSFTRGQDVQFSPVQFVHLGQARLNLIAQFVLGSKLYMPTSSHLDLRTPRKKWAKQFVLQRGVWVGL